jgi:hypothetical protein
MTGTGPEDFSAEDDGDVTPFGDTDGYDFEGDEEEYDLVGDAFFKPVPGGATCYFQRGQAGVIRTLVSQVADIIRSDRDAQASGNSGQPDELEMLLGLSGNEEPPDDPVLARLLPDAYKDDPDASAEFRRYTEESLRSVKINSAQAVLASLPAGGGEVRLNEAECQQWLRALNDVRLTLGVMLGISEDNEDMSDGMLTGDPRAAYIFIYNWVTTLQDSLIDALT